MPLDTSTLTSSLQSAFLANLPSPDTGQISQVNILATSIANALRIFVEGAEITYSAGLVAPGGGGPVTGVFGNTIS